MTISTSPTRPLPGPEREADRGGSNGSVMVADVGGTNVRFAMVEYGKGRPKLLQPMKLQAEEFASVLHAARHYLNCVGARPNRVGLAVACPVTGDEIRLTNRAWSFSRRELRRELGVDELVVMNDFGAMARAVPALSVEEQQQLYGDRSDELVGPVCLIGPGTGLGMALLAPPPVPGQDWLVIETEGGHASFAPQGSQERELFDWLAARHGRVSIERVLSGRGLSNIHAALSGVDPLKSVTPDDALLSPDRIVEGALEGDDQLAREALARFCAVFGSVAGDAALTHGARTLVIAGGVVPRFIPFLRASAFRERFLDKGRFAAYLESIRIVVVTRDEAGLLGVALAMQGTVAGVRS